MASSMRGSPLPLPLFSRPIKTQIRLPNSSLASLSLCKTYPKVVSLYTTSSTAKPINSQTQRQETQRQEEVGKVPSFPESEGDRVKRAMNPSLPYANIMGFKGPYNVQIFVDENESEDSITSRFRREVLKEGILQECKRRRYHENRQDIKKRKVRDAQRRNGRGRRSSRRRQTDDDEYDDDDDDDDDDNWELPEEDIGF
uniref:30S ribosomal protein S21, chloroplastic n=1 Tax=Araucaria cunninghamii TaxID=56994 RepID=A0A0D6R7Z8_ARACU